MEHEFIVPAPPPDLPDNSENIYKRKSHPTPISPEPRIQNLEQKRERIANDLFAHMLHSPSGGQTFFANDQTANGTLLSPSSTLGLGQALFSSSPYILDNGKIQAAANDGLKNSCTDNAQNTYLLSGQQPTSVNTSVQPSSQTSSGTNSSSGSSAMNTSFTSPATSDADPSYAPFTIPTLHMPSIIPESQQFPDTGNTPMYLLPSNFQISANGQNQAVAASALSGGVPFQNATSSVGLNVNELVSPFTQEAMAAILQAELQNTVAGESLGSSNANLALVSNSALLLQNSLNSLAYLSQLQLLPTTDPQQQSQQQQFQQQFQQQLQQQIQQQVQQQQQSLYPQYYTSSSLQSQSQQQQQQQADFRALSSGSTFLSSRSSSSQTDPSNPTPLGSAHSSSSSFVHAAALSDASTDASESQANRARYPDGEGMAEGDTAAKAALRRSARARNTVSATLLEVGYPDPVLPAPIPATVWNTGKVGKGGLKAYGGISALQWSPEEDLALENAVATHGTDNWTIIATHVPRRSAQQCYSRWNKALRRGEVRGPWTPIEDEILRDFVRSHADVSQVRWALAPQKLPGRLGKQCRERWYHHLDPNIRKGPFSAEEDRILIEGQARVGNKWTEIAMILKGRSENAVKNRWNSGARRKWFVQNGLPLEPRDKIALLKVAKLYTPTDDAAAYKPETPDMTMRLQKAAAAVNPEYVFLGGRPYKLGVGWLDEQSQGGSDSTANGNGNYGDSTSSQSNDWASTFHDAENSVLGGGLNSSQDTSVSSVGTSRSRRASESPAFASDYSSHVPSTTASASTTTTSAPGTTDSQSFGSTLSARHHQHGTATLIPPPITISSTNALPGAIANTTPATAAATSDCTDSVSPTSPVSNASATTSAAFSVGVPATPHAASGTTPLSARSAPASLPSLSASLATSGTGTLSTRSARGRKSVRSRKSTAAARNARNRKAAAAATVANAAAAAEDLSADARADGSDAMESDPGIDPGANAPAGHATGFADLGSIYKASYPTLSATGVGEYANAFFPSSNLPSLSSPPQRLTRSRALTNTHTNTLSKSLSESISSTLTISRTSSFPSDRSAASTSDFFTVSALPNASHGHSAGSAASHGSVSPTVSSPQGSEIPGLQPTSPAGTDRSFPLLSCDTSTLKNALDKDRSILPSFSPLGVTGSAGSYAGSKLDLSINPLLPIHTTSPPPLSLNVDFTNPSLSVTAQSFMHNYPHLFSPGNTPGSVVARDGMHPLASGSGSSLSDKHSHYAAGDSSHATKSHLFQSYMVISTPPQAHPSGLGEDIPLNGHAQGTGTSAASNGGMGGSRSSSVSSATRSANRLAHSAAGLGVLDASNHTTDHGPLVNSSGSNSNTVSRAPSVDAFVSDRKIDFFSNAQVYFASETFMASTRRQRKYLYSTISSSSSSSAPNSVPLTPTHHHPSAKLSSETPSTPTGPAHRSASVTTVSASVQGIKERSLSSPLSHSPTIASITASPTLPSGRGSPGTATPLHAAPGLPPPLFPAFHTRDSAPSSPSSPSSARPNASPPFAPQSAGRYRDRSLFDTPRADRSARSARHQSDGGMEERGGAGALLPNPESDAPNPLDLTFTPPRLEIDTKDALTSSSPLLSSVDPSEFFEISARSDDLSALQTEDPLSSMSPHAFPSFNHHNGSHRNGAHQNDAQDNPSGQRDLLNSYYALSSVGSSAYSMFPHAETLLPMLSTPMKGDPPEDASIFDNKYQFSRQE